MQYSGHVYIKIYGILNERVDLAILVKKKMLTSNLCSRQLRKESVWSYSDRKSAHFELILHTDAMTQPILFWLVHFAKCML